MKISIRKEQGGDAAAIGRVTEAAFEGAPYSNRAERFIVSALRNAGQLTLSLVALDGDAIVGHIAASPVTISSGATGWYGLGPFSVAPAYQRSGVGTLLMKATIEELQRMGAAGSVVLGDPAYYHDAFLTLPG